MTSSKKKAKVTNVAETTVAEEHGLDLAALTTACERVEAAISQYGAINLQVNMLDVTIDTKALVTLLVRCGLCTQAGWERTRAQIRLETLQTILTSLETQAATAKAKANGPRILTPPSAGKLAIVKH